MIKFWLLGFCVCVLVVTSIFTIGAFNADIWLFDLSSQFRLQYFIVQVVLLVIFLFSRHYKPWSVLAIVMLLINGAQIIPFYVSAPNRSTQFASGHLRVMQMNVLEVNPHFNWVETAVQKTHPDVIGFEEFTTRWQQKLALSPLAHTFPYHISAHDVSLYSRYPLLNPRIIKSNVSDHGSSVMALIKVQGHPVRLIVTHPHLPILPGWWHSQKIQFQTLIDTVNADPVVPTVLCGDLNTTSWSGVFRHMQQQTHLRDTRLGFGLQPSWPTFFIVPWLTIDHCLTTQGIITLNRKLGPFDGSDHLPVVIDMAIK